MARRKNKNAKKAVHAIEPSQAKQARSIDPDYRSKKVRWSFELFDYQQDWRASPSSPEDSFRAVAQSMRSFEGRTWKEIEANRKHDHPVERTRLCAEAQRRLNTLRYADDVDALWRFRFSGERRIWGIKQGDTLRVIWWDPNHQVCPSRLKHT